ncbi:MAG: SpaH/EbpB family LPXTG-anchored major pilin [Defluviitaleaceae bacterium]|nr:SpaH/EbpB family LPXTG-anchored major pilin [Defluviitaleaceae bacterium]
MSKLVKNVVAVVLAVALLIPGLSAFANPQVFGPTAGDDAPEYGSITVTRIAGDEGDYILTQPGNVVTPNAPGRRIPGVPIRVELVELIDVSRPTDATNVRSMEPMVVFYGVTDSNGEVTFPSLPLGIWLVSEVTTATVDGVAVVNPVNPEHHFADFLVGLPRYNTITGAFDFNVRVYPKSEIPSYEGTYKELVEVVGNVAIWELSHRIPTSVGNLVHFSVTDIMSSGLSFITDSVVGRFTMPGDENNDWETVTGELAYGTHFTVINVGQRIDIEVTEAGRAYLAAHGLTATGDVMFRLSTSIDRAGSHSNVSVWNIGQEPSDYDLPCPPTDEDCEDDIICPIDEPECDFAMVAAFNLEVLKRNIAGQSLDGAVFFMYRELTADELAGTHPAGTINNGTAYVLPLRDAAGVHITGTTGDLENGTTNFAGVPMSSTDHTLWLRETEAPAGYRYINPWMQINVGESQARPGTYIVDVTVYNEPAGGWILPETGGAGTIILTVVGLVLVGGALVLFVGSKKEDEVA